MRGHAASREILVAYVWLRFPEFVQRERGSAPMFWVERRENGVWVGEWRPAAKMPTAELLEWLPRSERAAWKAKVDSGE